MTAGAARAASLVSVIAVEATWNRAKRSPVRGVIRVELPIVSEAAIVAAAHPKLYTNIYLNV
jgi:hypothetical protein